MTKFPFFLLVLCGLILCGCGIKPGQLAAPGTDPETKQDKFPSTYPSE